MEFRCRLGTASGEILEDVYVADDEAKLRRELEAKGLHILSLRRHGALGWRALSFSPPRRIRSQEFLVFNQELAALLKAGMPLVQSLELLRERVETPGFKTVLDDVHERVRGGSSLSEAFDAQETSMPDVYTASLMSGEKSGSLEAAIRRYVTYARIISSVRRKTISALIYPAILLTLSFIVVGIIVLRVVPEFANFYESLGADLPLATQIIMSVSNVLRSYLWVILLVLVVGSLVLRAWFKQLGRGALLDRLLLRVPGVGPIARKFATSQFARTLATLLDGGIPLVNALDVSARSIGNRFVSRQLATISREVREGQALSTSMADREIFPPVAVKMVEVGESTGALQDMLNNVADFFDEEIETSLGRFMTLIEPILLVIMGIVIAGILLALYMPLLQLGTIVQ